MELGAYIKGMSFASAKDIIFLAIKNSQKTLKTLKLELLQTVSNTKNVIHSFCFVSMKCFGILVHLNNLYRQKVTNCILYFNGMSASSAYDFKIILPINAVRNTLNLSKCTFQKHWIYSILLC